MIKLTKILFSIFFIIGLSSCAGRSLPPSDFESQATIIPENQSPTPAMSNIALLLPLGGEIGTSSQAIKNGFLAAFYQAHEKNPNLSIKVFDTSGKNVKDVYQQAIQGGANIVVGPLTKQEVEALSNMGSLPVPTIALNTLDNYSHNVSNNFYQFGLTPQDEVIQAAERMHNAGLKSVAVIVPSGSWGEKISNSFKDHFEDLGGKVVAVMNYSQKDDLTAGICQLVTKNPEEMCVRHKNKNQGPKIIIERRPDIDSFFIVATPPIAREIVPLFKFYYAGSLPVFSISTIYTGNVEVSLDQDLNGVYFCDMPWVLQNSGDLSQSQQALRKQLQGAWPDSFNNYQKLYALGIDSLYLALNINQLTINRGANISGVTGKLRIDDSNHVFRQLDWAQFKQGQAG